MNNIPVAGVDVSKNFSDMCILSPDNTVFRTVKIYHDRISMERSLSFLKEAETEFNSKPVIIMEATGHYHRLLFQFLYERGYEVIVINPIQSGALRNINIRKIKTDKVDAHRIALFYRLNTTKISTVPSDKILCLRSLCRQHFDLKQDMISHANRLNSYLDQSFPGLVKLIDVLSKTALSVLSKYPTPQSVLDASEAELFELISASSRKGVRFSQTKTTLFKTAAKEAIDIGVTAVSSKVLIRTTAVMLLTLSDSVAEVDKEIHRIIADDAFLTKQSDLLKTIPGIADFSAAVLIAEIGDFASFKKPKQLSAFFGLDPSERQSGNFKSSVNRISKRGSPYVRKILHMAVRTNVFPMRNGKYINPVLAEYYQRKCVSKPPKSVMCAVMHKLTNIIFAVLRDQKPFELRTPEEHAKRIFEKAA